MAKTLVRDFDLFIVSKEISKGNQSPWKHNFYAPLLIIRDRNPLVPQSAWSKFIRSLTFRPLSSNTS